MKRLCAALAAAAAFFTLWELACDRGWVSTLLLPAPSAVAAWLGAASADGSLPAACAVTLQRLLAGYLPGLLLGLLLGMAAYRSRFVNDTVGTVALGLQALPSVCWTPLALLWFGTSEGAMRFVVIMGSMWAIMIAARNALSHVPTMLVNAARVMGTGRLRMWRQVLLPAALPALVAGARLGWAFAWRSLMAAEIYVTILSRLGLGQLLHYGRELMAMEQAMGVMLVIILLGIAVDKALFVPVERYLRRTRGQ